MKNAFLIFSLIFVGFSVQARTIQCQGQAEYGRIEIMSVVIKDQTVTLLAKDKRTSEVVKKSYIITEEKENYYTDLNQPAVFIGANTSGDVDDYSDDMSLSRLGMYRSGLGSDIAFVFGRARVFGEVSCVKR